MLAWFFFATPGGIAAFIIIWFVRHVNYGDVIYQPGIFVISKLVGGTADLLYPVSI